MIAITRVIIRVILMALVLDIYIYIIISVINRYEDVWRKVGLFNTIDLHLF